MYRLTNLLTFAFAFGIASVMTPETIAASNRESEDRKDRVTLDDIGADTPDLPDSAFTVPKGAMMIETSINRQREKDVDRTRTWDTASLVRVGLAKDWELRISGDGYIHQTSLAGRTSGFGDLTIGFKRHLWPERKGRPAAGIIVQTSLPTGRSGLGSGRMEPFASLNLGQPLPAGFELEVNLGGSYLNGSPERRRFVQGNLLWVVERAVSSRATAFVHGQSDFPSAPRDENAHVLGPGLSYRLGPFTQIDFSVLFGTTSVSPNQRIRFGFAIVH